MPQFADSIADGSFFGVGGESDHESSITNRLL
jgi:hypothetical protein